MPLRCVFQPQILIAFEIVKLKSDNGLGNQIYNLEILQWQQTLKIVFK